MARRDLYHNITGSVLLGPAVYKTTSTSSALDTYGYYGIIVEVISGTVTDGTFNFKLQESDDNVTYTDVVAADQIGSFTTISTPTSTAANQKVGYIGSKRYIQVVMTVTGSPATGAGLSILGVTGYVMHKPAPNQ